MNLVENLPVFAEIVLIAHLAGILNPTIVLGAQVFFWDRVVMAIGHIGGTPRLRSVAYFISIAGLIMILLQMF